MTGCFLTKNWVRCGMLLGIPGIRMEILYRSSFSPVSGAVRLQICSGSRLIGMKGSGIYRIRSPKTEDRTHCHCLSRLLTFFRRYQRLMTSSLYFRLAVQHKGRSPVSVNARRDLIQKFRLTHGVCMICGARRQPAWRSCVSRRDGHPAPRAGQKG